MPAIPGEFLKRMETLIGEEETARLAAELDKKPSVSIRINRKKVSDPEAFMERFASYAPLPVPWCNSGFYLSARPDFAHDPLFHAGAYYVQEAASMVYESIVAELLSGHDDSINGRPLLVADFCAAPGGKTTAILNGLKGNYLLVANEFERKRAFILKENIDKWGDPNVIITNSPVSKFEALTNLFDLIAVDAPCSGEGMMRREQVARTQWNPGLVEQCSALQREILESAVSALRPGGYLIFSTCTFNDIENEGNVEWLIENFGLEIIMKPRHFMPHRDKCEGLFVAAFRKPLEDSVNRQAVTSMEGLSQLLKKAGVNIISAGLEQTVKKGNLDLPSSRKVLSHDFDRNEYPAVNVTREEAVNYLRRNAITLPEGTPAGFVVVAYEDFPLGLVKNLGNRSNNLYPAEWRILS